MGRFLKGVIRFKGGIRDGGDLVHWIVLKQVAIEGNDQHRLLCEAPSPHQTPPPSVEGSETGKDPHGICCSCGYSPSHVPHCRQGL